ncbi:hypothetical protein BJV82DRAFT_632204, partial [Fennellomyces sp. T-0311]
MDDGVCRDTTLPQDDITTTVKEQELCTRYLDAALIPLFDDPSNNVFFRWTSSIDVSATSSSPAQPDVMISSLTGVHFSDSMGFAEVKSIYESNKSYAIAKDLVRLGTFSKEAIDKSKDRNTCTTIQAVGMLSLNNDIVVRYHHIHTPCFPSFIGRECIFYVAQLFAEGLYVMFELGSVNVPSSIYNLPNYPVELDQVINIVAAFETLVKDSKEDDLQIFAYCKQARAMLTITRH